VSPKIASEHNRLRDNERLKKLIDAPATIPMKSKKKGAKPRKIRTQKGMARFGKAYEFDVVIIDESHVLRNIDSARSGFVRKLLDPAEFVIWLSTTAGQNPLELNYLVQLLSEADGVSKRDLSDFPGWCKTQGFGVTKGAFGKLSWVGNDKEMTDDKRLKGDEDLERMRALLFDGRVPLGIRRSPSDIAGWPSVNRILLPVDLDPEDRAAYAKIWSEFRHDLGLERTGKVDSQMALVARMRFRLKASLLREAIAKQGIGVSMINGQIGAAEKEQQRLDFQYGRNTVCIYTVKEAISLHQGEYNDVPRSNLIHDLRWTAIPMKQIEGRTHRDGKFSQVYWMLGTNTVEEEIGQIVANRLRSMSVMHGDQETVNDVTRLLYGMAA
jgi:hypothetical protein